MEYEAGLGPHGREARVTRLRWEREQWVIRQCTSATIEKLAGERALEPGWQLPVEPVAVVPPASGEVDENCQPAPVETPDPIERAYAMADAIMAAGGMAGQRRRGTGSSDFRWTKG
jgi:hypothetical protein